MQEILDAPLAEMAAAVRAGSVTSVQLVNAFIERIEAVNPALNAMVYPTYDLAQNYAAKADADLKNGELQGPLHGVPMTIKDSLDTKDAVTTWGTMGRRDFRPGRDATCVARLREAGAVLLGKTNTPEFTLSFKTDNLVYGRTNNPFDTDRTPGGSSGGAAALISAGASPFDIGTDTGGSIRLPSHFSGITGIKPTSGRVPCTGNALPSSGMIAPMSQPGPMARHVADLSVLLPIIAGPDLFDPYCVAATWHEPADVDIKSLRFAYHTDNGVKSPTTDICDAIQSAITLLSEHGMTAVEARPTGLEMTSFIMSRVFAADGGELLDNLLEDCRTEQTSPPITRNLENRPLPSSAQEFAQVITLWDNYRSSMLGFFEDFDVLICPVNATTAIEHETPEDLSGYSYTMAYNLTGWPGVVIRAGTDSNGLPIGLQILSRPFREDHCLAVAGWLETLLGSFPKPDISAASVN